MEAIVAGYEAVIAIGRACHPDLRQRGFHPTAAVGVFGSVAAAGKMRGLSVDALAQAMVALSQLADDANIAEAEINPLIVRPAGEGVVAVDALVKLAGSA